MEKKTFKFVVTYFRASGKYYTHAEFEREVRVTGKQGDDHRGPMMWDVEAHFVGLRDNGGQGAAMPGLSTVWRGHILIECAEGFPCLIPAIVARDTE